MIRYLSLYDIMNSSIGAKAVRDGTEEDFKSFLWAAGFDTSKPIERQEVLHRPVSAKTNEPVFGMRFVGTERSDDEWSKSGLRSFEARMEDYRQNNFELYKEMTRMNYHHNHTGSLIDHMKNKGSTLPYYDQISGNLDEEEI